MRIGGLNERVTIQRATVTRDAAGAVVESWAAVATVWACVLPQKYTSGVEALVQALGREAVTTTYTVTIYHMTGLTERDRLMWEGRELDIKRVIDPDGKRAFLELLCEARP